MNPFLHHVDGWVHVHSLPVEAMLPKCTSSLMFGKCSAWKPKVWTFTWMLIVVSVNCSQCLLNTCDFGTSPPSPWTHILYLIEHIVCVRQIAPKLKQYHLPMAHERTTSDADLICLINLRQVSRAFNRDFWGEVGRVWRYVEIGGVGGVVIKWGWPDHLGICCYRSVWHVLPIEMTLYLLLPVPSFSRMMYSATLP